jgi:DNA-binding Xre family transcriptional regulator
MSAKKTAQVSRSIKAQLAEGIRTHMAKGSVSQSDLARRMKTSRAIVHRLLNPRDTSLTLSTLAKAGAALNLRVNVTLA